MIAESALREALPRRWAHSLGVAARAGELAPALGSRGDLLVAAAVLHDVGYAPSLAETGFHPRDGGRYLRTLKLDDEVVRLVANHSYALLEADERGLRRVLEAEFPLLVDAFVVDTLVYCDMTTTPDGTPTTCEQRLSEILSRYGADSVVGRFILRAAPLIRGSVRRVEERAAESEGRDLRHPR
jgi:putative nucleotidyltransferase with HDIG domain